MGQSPTYPSINVETIPYSAVLTGEIACGTVAAQLPSVACRLVRLSARANNAGAVYLGGPGVTRPDGATDTTTGFELLAGDDTGWLPVDSLAVFWCIGVLAGSGLTYLAVR